MLIPLSALQVQDLSARVSDELDTWDAARTQGSSAAGEPPGRRRAARRVSNDAHSEPGQAVGVPADSDAAVVPAARVISIQRKDNTTGYA